jgi:hypothetical protein
VCCAIFRGARNLARVPWGVGRMGDDSSKSPLTRRVPGATRAGPASSARPELPAELLQRMQAVVNAAHAQAKQEEQARGKQATSDQSSAAPRRAFTIGGGSKSSNGVRPKLTSPLQGHFSDEDAEFDTDELPRLTASGAIASPAPAGTGTAPPDHAAKPGRGDHAAKRDRRADRRERAAQAERERAERGARERAEREQADRERAREAELAARAVQVLREREEAAREQAAKKAAAQTERERAERADHERAAHERAEREQAERDRAARDRERAAHERAVQAEREGAARKAEQARERAAQAERERAEEEREQARRERAERESAAPSKRGVPAPATTDDPTQLIIAASTNGAATTKGADKPDSAVEQDGAVRPDETARSNGTAKPASTAKPTSTAKPVDHRSAATRADVLQQPRRMARQAAPRRRGRTIALVAAAAVVVAAGPIAIILSRHTAAPPDGSGSALRNEAAAWISQQVSPSDVVSCDLAMCQALEGYGVSTGNLLVMNPGNDQILSSQVVVSTGAIRHLFGSRLDSDYAPVVLASFGSGKAQIDVRVIAPHGRAAAYMSQLRTDEQERTNLGSKLAAFGTVTLSATAQDQLKAGQVDIRLQVDLTFLLDSGRVNVLAFGDRGPGASPGVPLRSVYLTETGAAANVREAVASLRGRASSFNPSHAETVRFDGKRALYIEFDAPPALGLISQ